MKKILVILSLLMGLFMVAGCVQREGKVSAAQARYLSKHEEELAKFVREYNEDEIHSLQFKWDTADVRNISDYTPWGKGRAILLDGTFSDSKSNTFRLQIWLDKDGNPNLDDISFLCEPKKNGKAIPNKPFSEKLQYLKDNEKELVRFVRLYNEDEIQSVKFDWDTFRISDVVDSIRGESKDVILLDGTFNGSKNTHFEIQIWLYDYGDPNIYRVEFRYYPSKSGKELPEKQSEK